MSQSAPPVSLAPTLTRRRHNRIALRLDVTLVLDDGRSVEAVARDLGAGGMHVVVGADARLVFGTTLRVRATLDGIRLDAFAAVRWTKGNAVGLQFGTLRAIELRAIHALLRRPVG